ncbi:TadE/TadG family type IV pilus assembly protein [Kitasatospora viridis]|uniref:TadE-like protein n=1 Tax=Kitasatospora viridis TaxID=281105 RepID=A0A561TW09_9ACTN|nr:TadE/TadG family type IV pilus assembly protein [Kitasatospora viridis]TWF91292.1 TadE-like protein [Kitasatospora viridis]
MSTRGDRGSVPVEMTLITPLLIMLTVLAVAMWRLAGARIDVEDAAHQAARAASLTRSPGEAGKAGRETAADALTAAGTSCPRPVTTVNTGSFRPGGQVVVTVSCEVSLADLSAVPLPGHQTITADFTAPLDTYVSDRS